MRIFMTGASGFIGSFLAEALVEQGHDVRCLVRTTSNLKWIADLNVDCFYASLFDKTLLKKGLQGADYVYHLAGITTAMTETDNFRINLEGTKSLVDAVIGSDVKLKRFVLISSQAAAGPSPDIRPINETHTPNPLTFYGKSKLAAEEYVRMKMSRIPATIVRSPVVYGPRDRNMLTYFKTVKWGIIPQLNGKDKYVSVVFVKDLVRGLIMAAEQSKAVSQTYYIADPQPCSYDAFARIILEHLGRGGVRVPVPKPLIKGIAILSEGLARLRKQNTILNRQKIIEMEQDFWVCSPSKAKKELGYESSTTLTDGIDETLGWYVRHNWL